MDKVLPLIVICSIGIAAAIGYIVYLIVAAFRTKSGKRRNEFEIDEDSLTIKLGRKHK